jgi:hypothetical protein
MGNKSWLVAIIISIFIFGVYTTTSPGETVYNHFMLLAEAFLKGKFYIEGTYPWLEKVPLDENKFYVTNPPAPAILIMPFVYFLGREFPQHIFGHLFGMGIVITTYLLSLKIKKDIRLAIFSSVAIGLGSIVWYLSSIGSTWYLGQLVSAFFLTWTLLEIIDKSRPVLLGILMGLTFLSRSHMALTFPLIVIMNWKKFKKLKKLSMLILTFSIFAGFGFYYNYARFGNPLSNGYSLIPDVDTSPWFDKGLWNPVYLEKNLKIMFLKLPIISKDFPYLIPSLGGMSILLTSPIFLLAFIKSKCDKIIKLSWISIIITLFIVASHGGTGFTQFGYRFAVDFYPFLMLILIKKLSKINLGKIHWFLLFVSILVNTWGVIFINKLNFVGW